MLSVGLSWLAAACNFVVMLKTFYENIFLISSAFGRGNLAKNITCGKHEQCDASEVVIMIDIIYMIPNKSSIKFLRSQLYTLTVIFAKTHNS